MEYVMCTVRFNGDLVTEETGEVIGKANQAQVARSYSAGNPAVGVQHSRKWFKEHSPRLALLNGW